MAKYPLGEGARMASAGQSKDPMKANRGNRAPARRFDRQRK